MKDLDGVETQQLPLLIFVLTLTLANTEFTATLDSSRCNLCCVTTPTYSFEGGVVQLPSCIPVESRCAWRCHMDKSCISFNYREDQNLCEIYYEEVADFKVIDGCVHFQRQKSLSTETSLKGVNLALRRPTNQSSNFASSGGRSDLAVDGRNDTNYFDGSCTLTGDLPGGPNWLTVDLGQPYDIDFVAVTSRIGGCGIAPCASILDFFIVGVTNVSPAVSPPVRGSYPLCGQYPSPAGIGQRMILFCGATTPPGRYVIVQQPADNPFGRLSLCELEVYARD